MTETGFKPTTKRPVSCAICVKEFTELGVGGFLCEHLTPDITPPILLSNTHSCHSCRHGFHGDCEGFPALYRGSLGGRGQRDGLGCACAERGHTIMDSTCCIHMDSPRPSAKSLSDPRCSKPAVGLLRVTNPNYGSYDEADVPACSRHIGAAKARETKEAERRAAYEARLAREERLEKLRATSKVLAEQLAEFGIEADVEQRKYDTEPRVSVNPVKLLALLHELKGIS